MAEPGQTPAERTPDFRVETVERIAGLIDADAFAKGKNWLVAALIEVLTWLFSKILALGVVIGGVIADSLARGEDKAQKSFGKLASIALQDMFGVEIDPDSLNDRGNRGRRTAASQALGRTVMQALTHGQNGNGATELTPSAAGAENYMSVVTQMALEGWLEGWIVELCSGGILKNFGELDDIMAKVMGLERATRRVMGPLLNARVITPFTWQVNKIYHPNLLTPAEAVRQIASGRWPRAQGFEELARQGWSLDRIEALLASQEKRLSLESLDYLLRVGIIDQAEAVQTLRDEGYDPQTASKEFIVRQQRRLDAIRDDMVAPAIAAYVDRRIGDADLDGFFTDALDNEAERAALLDVARARRALNTRRLSPGEARAAVKAEILAVSDYRRALRDDGYDEDAILTLELLLRHELAEAAAIADLRAAAAAERAAELATREAQRAARQRELEAERALTRRGAESDLERAAVRGLIPLARVDELYDAKYDAETAAIYLTLLEDERQRYLDEQARRAEALQRAARRSIDVGDLEQAVLNNILSLDQFRSGLAARGFDAGDVEILTRTLEARKADVDAARATRARAGDVARRRAIDLGRFEQLVRRGHRTVADYDALLVSLEFDEAARAGMRELLALQVADDTAAREARAAAERTLTPRGLSLEQFRRAVLLGLQTSARYETFLLDHRFTADVVALLMAELAEAVADAEAARQERQAADPRLDGRVLPLSVVARAARLGRVSPQTYQARLEREGFNEADVALQLDLVLAEIADVQAVRRDRDAPTPAAAPKGIALAELARAVRRGLESLEAFQARAIALGFTEDAVRTQMRILGDELLEAQAAKARKAQIAAGLDPGPLTLAALEDQVRAGAASILDFVASLVGLGVAPEDAELLGALLLDEQGEG